VGERRAATPVDEAEDEGCDVPGVVDAAVVPAFQRQVGDLQGLRRAGASGEAWVRPVSSVQNALTVERIGDAFQLQRAASIGSRPPSAVERRPGGGSAAIVRRRSSRFARLARVARGRYGGFRLRGRGMFRQGSSGEPARRPPALAPLFARFPGPVVVAASVPESLIALPGFEDADDRPWSVQVRYCDPVAAQRRVVVRTTRGSLDWTPVIETIENVYTVMVNCGARATEPVLEEPAQVVVDGESVQAVRIACSCGDCAVAFDWRGQHVYVVGAVDLVDGLRLRSGAVADFEAYEAAHLARYARRDG
jgi:hypothetical protein